MKRLMNNTYPIKKRCPTMLRRLSIFARELGQILNLSLKTKNKNRKKKRKKKKKIVLSQQKRNCPKSKR